MNNINWLALDTAFILLIIAITAITLILIMGCIWRTEGKFDAYLKLIACAFFFLLLKNILLLFGFRSYEYASLWLRSLDLLQILFFFFSNIELFIIIRNLSGESELKGENEEM